MGIYDFLIRLVPAQNTQYIVITINWNGRYIEFS